MAVNAAAVHERVDFEVSLQRLECPSLTSATFRGHALGDHSEWLQRLGGALRSKETLTELDLSSTALDDAALQQLVVMLSKRDVAPHLRTLRLGQTRQVKVRYFPFMIDPATAEGGERAAWVVSRNLDTAQALESEGRDRSTTCET